MKICLVIKRFNCEEVIGGAEAFAERLARTLAKKRHSLTVYSARYKPSWKSMEFITPANAGEYRIEINRLIYPDLRFIRSLFFLASLFWKLITQRKKYDVIFVSHASLELISVVLARMFTSKPVVCKVASSGSGGDIAQIKRRWFAPFAFRFFKRVDRFIALNGEVEEELVNIGVSSSAIATIPNGIDIEDYDIAGSHVKADIKKQLQCPEDSALIVSAGRLARQKGFDTLIKSVYLLREKGMKLQTIILGKGAERDNLMEMIDNYGLHADIRILFAEKNILKYLKAADIFVLPSRFEGLSNALLEAMSAGLPCIASDIPGNNSAIQHCKNGILFKVDDHVELAGAIGALIDDPDVRKRLGMEARLRVVQRYTIERTAEAYISLFSNLLGLENKDEESGKSRARLRQLDHGELEEVKCK